MFDVRCPIVRWPMIDGPMSRCLSLLYFPRGEPMSVSNSIRFAAMLAFLAAPLAAQTPAPPPMPKPGPEHALMNMDVGTWDAVVELNPGPGMPAVTSKGVEVNTLGCGGLCLITDF